MVTRATILKQNIITSIRRAYGVRFRNCWFMQDGAPAHRRLTVRDTLRAAFGNRLIGLGFGIEWPPRSLDLTPCDFFFWGHVKNQVFKTPPPSLEILQERIVAQFNLLKNNPAVIRKVAHSMKTRADRCIANGGHVEGY